MVPKIPTVIPTVDATDTPPPRIIPIIIKIFIFIASSYSCLILLIIYINTKRVEEKKKMRQKLAKREEIVEKEVAEKEVENTEDRAEQMEEKEEQ